MAKVAIIQTDIRWADPIANQQAVESALLAFNAANSNCQLSTVNCQLSPDLYVLPEMWNTGFMASQEPFFTLHSSLFTLKELALRFDAAIAGSMAVREGDRLYNRLYFVTPEETFFYDKRHLFSYAGEDKTFTAGGENPVVVEWRGVRYLLQVCYDLRFPCFSRNRLMAKNNLPSLTGEGLGERPPLYDAILYVANWPESRRRVWDILLQARALENQCFVIGVNRVGDDPNCHYNGGSVIIDAKGKTLASVADDTAGLAIADLDMQSLRTFREKFPVLRDADKSVNS